MTLIRVSFVECLGENNKPSLINQCPFMLKGGKESDSHSSPFDISVVKTHCSALLFVFPAPLLTTNVNRKGPQSLNRLLLASLTTGVISSSPRVLNAVFEV